MQVRLEVAHSKANVKRVVLRHDAVIGRSAECSLRIASSLVSRQHCQVLLREGGVYVRDLRSSNGTFLNGKPLRAYEDVLVPPGSELSVGGVRFYVRYTSERPPGPGSTVDLPGLANLPADSGTTAEWEMKDVQPQSAADAAMESQAPGTAAPDTGPAESGPAESGPEPGPDPGPAEAVPSAAPAVPKPTRVAMPFSIPVDAMAAPSVVPADVPAAAPDEEVVAAAGDEIDTLMIESEGPSEQETIDAGAFRFGDFAAESFEAPAETGSDEPSEGPAPADAAGKKGLRSLFTLFGRKKVAPSAAGPAVEQPAAPPDTEAQQEDTVSEDAPTAEVEPEAAGPQTAPASADAAEEAAADPDPMPPDPAAPGEQPVDEGFSDFLKQIGH